jgi:hypothetical protein
LEALVPLGNEQRRMLSAIAQCRTAALGGHVDRCQCGFERPSYNSCRNRHCPKCQSLAQETWIDGRTERLLPVRHFHVVFTLPSELRSLAAAHRRSVFGALFKCASDTLQELSLSRLGGTLGATMILHTWSRDLGFHPHIHAIVTAGALSSDGQSWKSAGKKYLFPVRVMGELLRGKMLSQLRSLHAAGEFGQVEGFERTLSAAARPKHWNVYAKKPFRKSVHVLKYLGRYTHRVGISNSRLRSVTDKEVVFRTRGAKTATLSPVEFLRRFVRHVLPSGFLKIRHYGLYAAANYFRKHPAALALLSKPPRQTLTAPSANVVSSDDWRESLRQLTGRDPFICPRCGGLMVSITVPAPAAQGPPPFARCA